MKVLKFSKNRRKHSNNVIKDEKFLCLRYLNIQGLTNPKMFELKPFLKSINEILLLTETHITRNKIKFDPGIKALHKMRETTDRKGGGLCIMINKK